MNPVERFSHTPKFKGKASDVVLIPLGTGRHLLMMSGVAAEIPEGRWLHADGAAVGDIGAQLRFVWKRIGELLQHHNASCADIVKLTLYTTDARYLMDPVGTYLAEVFPDGVVPAMTGVVVSGLAWPGLMIEIDVTAVV